MAILDISKIFLYDFHYNYIKQQFKDKAKLLYCDTDSLVYHFFIDDIYQHMKKDIFRFETSDYEENNPFGMPRKNKKVIGLMKDENNGKIMTHFIGLRSKMYTFKVMGGGGGGCGGEDDWVILKKTKGIQRSALKEITFDDYYKCLMDRRQVEIQQNFITTSKHNVYTVSQKKVALSPYDDKRMVNYLYTDTVLSLGNKYNLPYAHSNLPVDELLTDTDFIVEQYGEDEKIIKRNKCVNIITNYLTSNCVRKKEQSDSVLTNKDIKDTKHFLKTNKNVIITTADKGNTTVVLYRNEYMQKANQILNDTSTYKKLNVDPTTKIQNKLNTIIDMLVDKEEISKDQAKALKCKTGVPPRIYFQPKIHKNNTPLRPIVSFVGSPLYNLTRFIADILKHVFNQDEHYVKNSFQLVEQLRNTNIPEWVCTYFLRCNIPIY
nr:unnamed protein product [Callosobruchus analis]